MVKQSARARKSFLAEFHAVFHPHSNLPSNLPRSLSKILKTKLNFSSQTFLTSVDNMCFGHNAFVDLFNLGNGLFPMELLYSGFPVDLSYGFAKLSRFD